MAFVGYDEGFKQAKWHNGCLHHFFTPKEGVKGPIVLARSTE